jgi:multiple sugar transport system ATP-binding protein
MDEPLSNLDAKLRVQTRTDIVHLQRELGVTTVYVTHDQVEAMTMGERVAVMKDGELQQVGTPMDLYKHPVNVFVAGFIGSPAMNLIDAEVRDGEALVGGHAMPLIPAARSIIGRATVGVRPEGWRVVGADDGVPVSVGVVEELGSDAFVYGRAAHPGHSTDIVVRVGGDHDIRTGDVIHVTANPSSIHVFDATSGARV